MSERTLLEKANTLCERIEADATAPRGEVREIIFAIRDTLRENESLQSSNALLARKVEIARKALSDISDSAKSAKRRKRYLSAEAIGEWADKALTTLAALEAVRDEK